MSKAKSFLSDYFRWIYPILSLLLIILFFVPLYDSTVSNILSIEIPSDHTVYKLSNLNFFQPNAVIAFLGTLCGLAILFGIIYGFTKKKFFRTVCLLSVSLICMFFIIYISGQIGTGGYAGMNEAYLTLVQKPKAAFYLSIGILALTLLSLIIDDCLIKSSAKAKKRAPKQ